ncbi:cobalamin B12-binding domain-containing protein [Micromonospora sp. WMMD1102]|uniref:cobalamin B12-binding domain-containing protein n=1 Tax=Micromonospora sp. WMMD1102 TaxID=3016105 RepID=UPI0024156A58|nr:cobalamin B12-binding domain-containing protein [Micromonospora sp. WMMD1102]MDG4786088.1 cobalamin B12-binding domain-containing protein [Micromonospora sp. WMMD1102]
MTAVLGRSLEDAYPAYLRCLDEADEHGAIDLALELLTDGVDPQDVLLSLVAPAQAQVGEWWQRNEWSVAQEHAATHVSERVIAAVSATVRRQPHRDRVVVACMDGEWHALPARLVAEVLRLDGWDVTFLGASVPAVHLVSYLHRHDPRAVAIGCSLPMRLPHASRFVQACRRADVPVLVGGRGFGSDGRWAARLGVPWVRDARAASTALAEVTLPAWGTAPTVDDTEYAGLVAARVELIDLCVARIPDAARYTPAQLDATVADLGYIVDTLAAAVYVDDATLFAEFAVWLGEVLASRKVPLRTVDTAFDLMAGRLRDFPRALRILRSTRLSTDDS